MTAAVERCWRELVDAASAWAQAQTKANGDRVVEAALAFKDAKQDEDLKK